MQKWDYLVVDLGASSETVQENLKTNGEEGWELVHIAELKSKGMFETISYRGFFKRPLEVIKEKKILKSY